MNNQLPPTPPNANLTPGQKFERIQEVINTTYSSLEPLITNTDLAFSNFNSIFDTLSQFVSCLEKLRELASQVLSTDRALSTSINSLIDSETSRYFQLFESFFNIQLSNAESRLRTSVDLLTYDRWIYSLEGCKQNFKKIIGLIKLITPLDNVALEQLDSERNKMILGILKYYWMHVAETLEFDGMIQRKMKLADIFKKDFPNDPEVQLMLGDLESVKKAREEEKARQVIEQNISQIRDALTRQPIDANAIDSSFISVKSNIRFLNQSGKNTEHYETQLTPLWNQFLPHRIRSIFNSLEEDLNYAVVNSARIGENIQELEQGLAELKLLPNDHQEISSWDEKLQGVKRQFLEKQITPIIDFIVQKVDELGKDNLFIYQTRIDNLKKLLDEARTKFSMDTASLMQRLTDQGIDINSL